MPELRHATTVCSCVRALAGSCCADFSRNRWSCQGSTVSQWEDLWICVHCECVCACVCPSDFLLCFSANNQSHTSISYQFCILLHLCVDRVTLTVAVEVISQWSLAHLSPPLTLSSLILLERLFTAKLVFANMKSHHNPTAVCVCVCACTEAGLCICDSDHRHYNSYI